MNQKLSDFLQEQENLEFFRRGEEYLLQAAKAGRLPEETADCPGLEAVECFLDKTGSVLKRFHGYLHLKLCDSCREYASAYSEETDIEQQYTAIAYPPAFTAVAFAGKADAVDNARNVPFEMTVDLPIRSKSVTFIIKKQIAGDGSIMKLSVSPVMKFNGMSPIPRGVKFCYSLYQVSGDQLTSVDMFTSESLEIMLDRKNKYILFIGDADQRLVEIDDSDL